MSECISEYEYALRRLFGMMNNSELAEVKKNGTIDSLSDEAKKIYEQELYARDFAGHLETVLGLKDKSEETWIVTYLYSPLGTNPADSNWWGFGSVALKAKSAAEASRKYPDVIKNPEWTAADGSVKYRGPWQLSALSIFSIGDNPAFPMPDAIGNGEKAVPDEQLNK